MNRHRRRIKKRFRLADCKTLYELLQQRLQLRQHMGLDGRLAVNKVHDPNSCLALDLRTVDELSQLRWAWIIERKYDEWNIIRKVEQDVTLKKDGAAALAAAITQGDDDGVELD